MKHSITVKSAEFGEAIKTAFTYASKDNDPTNGLCYILITLLPKAKKVAIIACDGHGYYERRLNLVSKKGQKPSLPDDEQRLGVFSQELAMLTKFVGGKGNGDLSLEVDEEFLENGRYSVKLTLPNGVSSTFFARRDINIPDYSKFCKKAGNSKKTKPSLSNLLVPIHELVRAGKAFPSKFGSIARIFTCNAEMALLEYKTDSDDIRVIFTFARDNTASA